ncbi:MAG: ribulose-phosphate 3-epimerase [Planctomycetota bacterium]|nr:MAG: ribulose-phosphate 3-epimerase [Planctomycetota bacterium]
MSQHDPVIAPSLLSADFARLGDELRRSEDAGADWHHVDVMDGHFVPNLTIGPLVVEALAKVARIPLDVHLMITDPWSYGPQFAKAGAARVGFHVEMLSGVGALPGRYADLPQRPVSEGIALCTQLREQGASPTITINPDVEVEQLAPLLPHVDMVLVMSVYPGFGGQSFIPEVLPKLRALRERYGFQGRLQIDGGVSSKTIESCAQYGCDSFVAGSALYGAQDMAAEIRLFRERIAGARS